jgi:hypothetical protein
LIGLVIIDERYWSIDEKCLEVLMENIDGFDGKNLM